MIIVRSESCILKQAVAAWSHLSRPEMPFAAPVRQALLPFRDSEHCAEDVMEPAGSHDADRENTAALRKASAEQARFEPPALQHEAGAECSSLHWNAA
eukprot:2810227-Pleurochrysis_carterae.AAC.2